MKSIRLWVAAAAVAALCAAPGSASGSINQWHPLVESGTSVISVAQAPSQPDDIYFLSQSQLFASSDAGSSWTTYTLPCFLGTSLAVDPTAPLTVFVGCSNGGVYRSDDGGSTWYAADAGLSANGVNALAIAPDASHTLYAGEDQPGVDNLFRSTDGGATWTPIYASYGPVSGIAFDTADPTRLAAATWAGVILSTDGGNTWSGGFGTVMFERVAFDPSDPSTLWATRPGGDVEKSTDGGQTWTDLSAGPTHLHALAVGPGVVYVGGDDGVFQTTDGGAGWQKDDLYPQVTSAIAIDQGDTDHLFVGMQQVASEGSAWSAEFEAGYSDAYLLMATDPVSDLTPTSATFHGTIAALFPGDYGFYAFGWGLSSPSEHTIGFQSLTAATTDQAVSQSLTGLTPETTYHVAVQGSVLFLQNPYSSAVNEVTFTTPPAVGPSLQAPPTATFTRGKVDGGQLPVALSWVNQAGTYPIASAEAEASRAGGSWRSLTSSGLGRATGLAIPGGAGYRFRARVTDDHAMTSPWATTGAVVPKLIDDSSSSIAWSRGWRIGANSDAVGGRVHSATTPVGMTFSFTGHSLAVIAPLGPHLAPFLVTMDGHGAGTITPTVSGHANRRIITVFTWPTDGAHTLHLQARPTAACPTAVLDALAVLQ